MARAVRSDKPRLLENIVCVKGLLLSASGAQPTTDKAGAAHMHNTRGLGLANCLAAYDVGVKTFDSSLGGLGGCPYAPGASGNVVTEDLVFMFEAMGIRTGIDIPKLLAAREALHQGLPEEPIFGMVADAGLPKGWRQAGP